MRQLSEEQLEKAKQLLVELDADNLDQAIIQDNKILFPYEKHLYRCKMPSQKIQSICEDVRNQYQVQLLESGTYKTKRQLKVILREKQGIDIDELEKELDQVRKDLQDVMLNLANTQSDNNKKIKERRDKIINLRKRLWDYNFQISEYLAPCLEERVLKKYFEYATYLCTEKQVPGKKEEWVQVWKSFEKFEVDDSPLPYHAIKYLRTLLMNIHE